MIEEGDHLNIIQGRHPVVEQTLRAEEGGLAGAHAFVPNDCSLNTSDEQIALPPVLIWRASLPSFAKLPSSRLWLILVHGFPQRVAGWAFR